MTQACPYIHITGVGPIARKIVGLIASRSFSEAQKKGLRIYSSSPFKTDEFAARIDAKFLPKSMGGQGEFGAMEQPRPSEVDVIWDRYRRECMVYEDNNSSARARDSFIHFTYRYIPDRESSVLGEGAFGLVCRMQHIFDDQECVVLFYWGGSYGASPIC